MENAVAFLDGIVAREDELWIVVANLLQRRVFPVFRGFVGNHRHGDLCIGVIRIAPPEDEVAFKRADASDAGRIAVGARIDVNGVLECGTVVDAIVRVGREIEAEIGQVELLFPADRASGFQVETVAFVKYLCVLEYRDVPVQGLALDVYAGFSKIVHKVGEAGCRPEIVDEVRLDALECRDISDLDPSFDVLLEDFGDDTLDVGPAIIRVVILHGLRESALPQEQIELLDEIRRDGLAEKSLHAEILVEGKGKHLEFDVASGQLGDEFAAEQVGV